MQASHKGRRLERYVEDYVVFDLETTGISPNWDEIIEISAVKVEQGRVVDRFSTLVNPGRRIPAGASAVNGITDQMVADAPAISKVMGSFMDFIGEAVLVGHNIHSFDLKFIRRDLLEYLDRELTNDYIDTLYMARRCLPQLSHHRLTDISAYYHIATEGAHRALNDCIMNQQCYEEMKKTARESGMIQEKEGNVGRSGSTTFLGDLDRNKQPEAVCPECGGNLIRRNGRYGEFYGCGNFPRCRFTRNI
ncbi:MAG: DNA polymerase III subunit epsilon [Clostridiales bacterium]|nr:DNA polymerase III subunit epsilon [Clostridiales bacterium]